MLLVSVNKKEKVCLLEYMIRVGKIGTNSSLVLISELYFLLCFLILPDNWARRCVVVFAIPLVLVLREAIANQVSRKDVIRALLVIATSVCALLPSFFSVYSQKYTIDIWLYLLLAFALFGIYHAGNEEVDKDLRLFFCWGSLAVLFFYSFIHTDYSQGDLAFSAYNNDKNYAAFIVFLMFMIYMKLRFLPGVIFPLIFFVFCNKSRGLLFCLLVFFVIRWGKIAFKKQIKVRRGYTLLFCVLSTLAVIGFSYLFMYGEAFSTMGGYRDSLVDGSNKMRFNANVYAVNFIHNNKLIWSGLGSDLTRFMGVDDGLGNYMINIQYNGFRLVQSHDSVINIATRIGIIPTLLYLFVLGIIADKYKTYDNLEYYYSFLVYGLILNYYYGPWLLAWFFVLFLKPVNYKYRLFIGVVKN